MKKEFLICVNQIEHTVICDPSRTLLDVIRDDLRLTGTKRGCDVGVCGTCTVLINGKVRRACNVSISEVAAEQGANQTPPDITTIEGLEEDGKLHPIQQSFIDCGAIQCGFCTPGMVLSAKALLDANPSPTRDEIKKALAGNLCRCTGYQQIFEAVENAATVMRNSSRQKHK